MGLKNKKKIIAVILIVVIVIISGITYGYWNKEYIGKNNTNNFNCLNITKISETSGITLNNAYPITDEEGINDSNNVYEVQIKNTCNLMVQYNVIANIINNSNLEESHVKIGSKKTTEEEYAINLLSNYEETTPTVEEVKKARVIKRGYLKKDETTTISIKEWMDYETTKEEGENKKFISKITIEGINGENTLGGKILANNEVIEKEPDFKKGEPSGEDCSQVEVKDKTGLSLYSTSFHYIGDSFEYNGIDNGQYTIKNDGIKVDKYTANNFTDSDIGKYICFGYYNPCTKLYRIKEISEDKKSIIKADEYTSTCKSKSVESGLYKAEDDDGESYYFRGEIKNNYIKFADMLWKVIRINGDGSIRLILTQTTGESVFNENGFGSKYAGYTYDNNISCTKEKPCKVNYENGIFINENGGQNSSIKTYLETWYKDKLNDYNDKIATSYFCNDTSYGSGNENENETLYYGAFKRIFNDNAPSLKCPNPTKQDGSLRDYGGIYKTKIGLVNADEVNMAGSGVTTADVLLPVYMYYRLNWRFLSPGNVNIYSQPGIFGGNNSTIYFGSTGSSKLNVIPVINLKFDTKVVGDGTSTNPYIVN